MACQPTFGAKDPAEGKLGLCMNSLKRALDDVQFNTDEEPTTKKVRKLITKKYQQACFSSTRAQVDGRTPNKKIWGKKCIQKLFHRPTKLLKRKIISEIPGGQQKINMASGSITRRKGSKRSSDCMIQTDIGKKLKLEATEQENVSEEKTNASEEAKATGRAEAVETKATGRAEAVDETKVTCEDLSDDDSDAALRTDSTKSDQPTGDVLQSDTDKEYSLALQTYYARNVAFARKVVVYTSDGSEYDYDYSDDGCDACIDDIESPYSCTDDDGDLYDDYGVPYSEEAAKRKLHREIKSYLKKYKTRGATSLESDSDEEEDECDYDDFDGYEEYLDEEDDVQVVKRMEGNKMKAVMQYYGHPSASNMFFLPNFKMLPAIEAPPPPKPEKAEGEIAPDINGNQKEEVDRSEAASAYQKPALI